MAAWRYGIDLLVLRNIALVRCAHSCDISQHSKVNSVSLHGHVICSRYVADLREIQISSNNREKTRFYNKHNIYSAAEFLHSGDSFSRGSLCVVRVYPSSPVT